MNYSRAAPLAMMEFLSSTPAQAIIYITIAIIMCVVGYFLLQRLRESTKDEALPASEVLSNFRELHEQGGLSDAEYRTIKSVAGEQLKAKLSDKEETT